MLIAFWVVELLLLGMIFIVIRRRQKEEDDQLRKSNELEEMLRDRRKHYHDC